jgi:serine/threonine protein kinase
MHDISLFADEFAEKRVKKYIDEGLWLECNLSNYYMYLEYYDEGGYGSIHKVMDRFSGEYLILKRSSKKDFVPGCLTPYLQSKGSFTAAESKIIINGDLHPSKEAEFMLKIREKLGSNQALKLHDYYDDDDHYILVMEDGGRSLENVMCCHKKKIIDLVRYEAYRTNFFYQTHLNKVIEFMIEIYHKIKDIHDLGIHHNDLKPENILVNGKNVTIIDFGVAKKMEPSYERYRGTLEYVPFEYVENGSYKPWDHTIWCFGIMLHFLTLMKYPFLKEEEVLAYNLNHKKINKLPERFSNLIYDCLRKDPSKRPQNLLERLQDLRLWSK